MLVCWPNYAFLVPLIVCGLGSAAQAQSYRPCDGGAFEDRQLYVLDNNGQGRCWKKPTRVGGEFTRDTSAVVQLRPNSAPLEFVYVVSTPRATPSAVVVKERYFRPGVLMGEPGKGYTPDKEATDRVYLDRPRVTNACADYPDLTSRYGPDPSANFQDYNYYHSNESAIARDPILQFHFSYPVNVESRRRIRQPDCRSTDDIPSGNRRQFVLRGVEIENRPAPAPIIGVFRVPRFMSGAQAQVRNNADVRLRVRNLYFPKSANGNGNGNGNGLSRLDFVVPRISGTRLELTIADLEHRVSPTAHQPSRTWQIDTP